MVPVDVKKEFCDLPQYVKCIPTIQSKSKWKEKADVWLKDVVKVKGRKFQIVLGKTHKEV